MIPPLSWEPYPPEIWDFWQTRYVAYRAQVHVPGRAVEGGVGWGEPFEAVVAGDYRWLAHDGAAPALEVDGRTVPSGGVVRLEAGGHQLRLTRPASGMLALALERPPAPDTTMFFKPF